uniref:Ribosomal protein L6 n=1 Tax=Rhodomonas salina TaxID=3034 RepID=Q9G8U7_RHDSA|nr:ribosomal protein L6 [Rhodomonas salina]AAG17750.1 ribosomal protein L6 [Rhodomonas salina]
MRNNISCLYFFRSYLVMSGEKGRFVVHLNSKFLNCFFIIEKNFLFFVDYKRKVFKERLSSLIENGLKGVCYNFSKKLSLVGVGFRCWTVCEKDKKFLVVKTSLSRDCILFIPETVDVLCLNSATVFVTGVRKSDVNSFILSIKRIKKPNFYKQKGIFLENETIKVKVGKKM